MCFSSVTFLYRPDRLISRVSLQHLGSAHMLLGFMAFTLPRILSSVVKFITKPACFHKHSCDSKV